MLVVVVVVFWWPSSSQATSRFYVRGPSPRRPVRPPVHPHLPRTLNGGTHEQFASTKMLGLINPRENYSVRSTGTFYDTQVAHFTHDPRDFFPFDVFLLILSNHRTTTQIPFNYDINLTHSTDHLLINTPLQGDDERCCFLRDGSFLLPLKTFSTSSSIRIKRRQHTASVRLRGWHWIQRTKNE